MNSKQSRIGQILAKNYPLKNRNFSYKNIQMSIFKVTKM